MSWYKSSVPREWILKICVCTAMPGEPTDEHWFSEDLQAHCVRCGTVLNLVGEKIPVVSAMFRGFLSLEQAVGLEHLDASAMESLSSVFEGCASLTELDLNAWNVSKVKCFSKLFKDCRSLRVLHIGNWNTASAEDISGLFSGCIRLETVDVSRWTLSNVHNLSCLFLECNCLQSLDVSHWNVAQVRDFSHSFACCYRLKSLDVSHWNTVSADCMEGLFSRCKALQELDVSGWKTEQVRNFRKLFYRCGSLKILDLRDWSFSKGASLDGMFLGMNGQLKLPRDRRFRTLAEGDSWFRKGLRPTDLRHISSIHIQKKGKELAWFDKCWAADQLNSGVLRAYKKGDELLLDCRNGALYSNENSIRAFSIPDSEGRSWLSKISGLELLNSRYTRDFRLMFAGNSLLTKPDDSLFDFHSAEWTEGMFEGCRQAEPKLRIVK